MTRLTNWNRDKIIDNAIAESFKKRDEALKKEEEKICMKLYKHTFSKKELDAVNAMDKKWFRLDKCLRFNCGGYNLRFELSEGVPVPYNGDRCSASLANISDPDLVKLAQDFAKRKEDERLEKQKAERQLKALVYSVSTAKRLKEVWPEGEQFYVSYLDVPDKPNVPMVQVQEINAMLGLKAKTK